MRDGPSLATQAEIALTMVCSALSGFDIIGIGWTPSEVTVVALDPAQRQAIADRLGLGPVAVYPGLRAQHSGTWADISILVEGQASLSEANA